MRIALLFIATFFSFQSFAASTVCEILLQGGLVGLDDETRGWAVLDVSETIDPKEVARLYFSTPNEIGIRETSLIQDLETGATRKGYAYLERLQKGLKPQEIGVNFPLSLSLRFLIKTTMERINLEIPTKEAGRLVVVEARLRRTDGINAITPTSIHRDQGYMVVNVNLLGDGTVLFLQDKETKDQGLNTSTGHAVVFSGKDRAAKSSMFDAWKAGPHAAPDSDKPRLTLSWVVHLRK